MKNDNFIPDLPELANNNDNKTSNLVEDEVSNDLSTLIKNIKARNQDKQNNINNKRIENAISNITNKKVILDTLPKLQEDKKAINKSSKKEIALIVITALVGILVSMSLVYAVFKITDHKKDTKIKESSTISTKTINYNNYQFTIPKGYEAKKIEDGIEFTNQTEKVDIIISTESNFQLTDIIQIKNTLRQQFKNLGYNINSVVQKTYDNRSFLIFETTKDNKAFYYSFADIGQKDIARIGLFTEGIIDDETVYNTISKIISTASISKSDNKNKETNVSLSAKEYTFKLNK